VAAPVVAVFAIKRGKVTENHIPLCVHHRLKQREEIPNKFLFHRASDFRGDHVLLDV